MARKRKTLSAMFNRSGAVLMECVVATSDERRSLDRAYLRRQEPGIPDLRETLAPQGLRLVRWPVEANWVEATASSWLGNRDHRAQGQ